MEVADSIHEETSLMITVVILVIMEVTIRLTQNSLYMKYIIILVVMEVAYSNDYFKGYYTML